MFTMGIDIGSCTCKGIILKNGVSIISRSVVPLGAGTVGASRVFEDVLARAGLNESDIAHITVTGYGRFSFAQAQDQKTELSCHAKGISYLVPSARTVIDIGGQDVKVLRIDKHGSLQNFVMNDKCAAGTGRFLEVMAGVLNLKMEDLGTIDERAEHVASISSTCTVFAESEVISKLSANVPIPDLVAGIHASVAKRVAGLVFRNGLIQDIAMSGGVALNKGVVRALAKELKCDILVDPDCQLAGALGAAMFAFEKVES